MHTITQLLTAAQDLASACQRAKELLRLFGAPPDQVAFLEAAISQYHSLIESEISKPENRSCFAGNANAYGGADGR